MGRLQVLMPAALMLLSGAAACAGNIDLYDFALSVSGGISGDWQDVSTTDPTTIIDGTSSIVCCGDASGGTTPGLGMVNYTFTGAPGTYTVSMYFDFDVSTPFFNEFGTINGGAGAQSGISYEIFNADSKASNIVLFGATGTAGGETYGLANGSNNVPGTTSNYSASCTAAGCNADVGMALSYTFTLGVSQEAVLTALTSTTAPTGFSLETTHPVDPNNATASNVYLTGSYMIQSSTVGGGGGGGGGGGYVIPEPSTWVLGATAFVFLGIDGYRRKVRV